jgi:hypothetical protein
MKRRNEMNEAEKRMYGMSAEDIQEQYMDSLTAKFCGLEMVVASLLSDTQELMAMGHAESARKQMNIAKYVLFEMMDRREEKEAV